MPNCEFCSKKLYPADRKVKIDGKGFFHFLCAPAAVDVDPTIVPTQLQSPLEVCTPAPTIDVEKGGSPTSQTIASNQPQSPPEVCMPIQLPPAPPTTTLSTIVSSYQESHKHSIAITKEGPSTAGDLVCLLRSQLHNVQKEVERIQCLSKLSTIAHTVVDDSHSLALISRLLQTELDHVEGQRIHELACGKAWEAVQACRSAVSRLQGLSTVPSSSSSSFRLTSANKDEELAWLRQELQACREDLRRDDAVLSIKMIQTLRNDRKEIHQLRGANEELRIGKAKNAVTNSRKENETAEASPVKQQLPSVPGVNARSQPAMNGTIKNGRADIVEVEAGSIKGDNHIVTEKVHTVAAAPAVAAAPVTKSPTAVHTPQPPTTPPERIRTPHPPITTPERIRPSSWSKGDERMRIASLHSPQHRSS